MQSGYRYRADHGRRRKEQECGHGGADGAATAFSRARHGERHSLDSHDHHDEESRPFQPAYLQRKLIEARNANEHIVDIRERPAVHCDGEHCDGQDERVRHARAQREVGQAFVFQPDEQQGKHIPQPQRIAQSLFEKIRGRQGGQGQIAPEIEVGLEKDEVEKYEEEQHGRQQFRRPRDGAEALCADVHDGHGKHDNDDVEVYARKQVHGEENDRVDEIYEAFQHEIKRHQSAQHAVEERPRLRQECVRAAPRKGVDCDETEQVDRRHEHIKPQRGFGEVLRDESGERGHLEHYSAGEDYASRLRIVNRGGGSNRGDFARWRAESGVSDGCGSRFHRVSFRGAESFGSRIARPFSEPSFCADSVG